MPPLRIALPLLLLGVTLAAYWYRVLRMAGKASRRNGHSANFLPPEKTGRVLRAVWMPIVAIWVAHPFFSALVSRAPGPLQLLWPAAPGAWLGFAGALGCFIATRYCWRQMGAAWRMGIDPNDTTPLITSGAYGYVRHPIYTLSAGMMLFTTIGLPSPLMFGVAVAHVLLLSWEARREEVHQERLHGERYRNYRSHVGRLVPRSVRPFSESVRSQ